MGDLAVALAAPDLHLAGALYAEGGPEATLVAGAGPARWLRLGSYETGFWEDDSNHTGWDVPNVLAAIPIGPARRDPDAAPGDVTSPSAPAAARPPSSTAPTGP